MNPGKPIPAHPPRIGLDVQHGDTHRFPFDAITGRLDGTLTDQARQLHLTRRAVYRLHANGLNWKQADHYAVRLGCHPAELWPDWFDHDTPEN